MFQTFFSKYSVVENFKICHISSMKRNEGPFHENSIPCRKQSRCLPPRSGERQALQDLTWLARANCHMFQLVWLWMMIHFYYFWQFVVFFWTVITFSRAGFLPELKMMTNRPFLTTCCDFSLD